MQPKLALLLVVGLFPCLCSQAGIPRKGPLETLILSRVTLRNSDFDGALQILKQEAEKQSGGAIKVRFALELPKDFKPRNELNLELKTIPFSEALHYLGELAGVEFSTQGSAVTVRVKGAVAVARPVPQAQPSATPASTPAKGLTGTLGKPPEPVRAGAELHRSMNGEVQPEQSGHVAHRTLSGWSVTQDPKNKFDVDCNNVATCPNGCGCYICACKKSADK